MSTMLPLKPHRQSVIMNPLCGIFRRFSLPCFCLITIVIVGFFCASSLWSHWMKRRELPTPLFTDVTVSPLELPGQTSDGCGRLLARLVQPVDVVAVFGRVVLHGSNFDAFLVAELQNGEDASKFTDHPVLERGRKRETLEHSGSLHPHTWCFRGGVQSCDPQLMVTELHSSEFSGPWSCLCAISISIVKTEHLDSYDRAPETLCPGTSVPGTAALIVKFSTPAPLRESSIFCLSSTAAECLRPCSAAACLSSANLTHRKINIHESKCFEVL